MAFRRAVTVGVLLAAGAVLAGCSGAPDASEGVGSPSPSASSGTPSPVADPGAAEDESLLPMPVDDIPGWAKEAVPGSDSAGFAAALSGWLGENSSPHQLSNFPSLEPGDYQAQIACRGGGEITVTTGELDGEASSEPVECVNATIAFDVTTTATGMRVQLDLSGDPSIFAISLLSIS